MYPHVHHFVYSLPPKGAHPPLGRPAGRLYEKHARCTGGGGRAPKGVGLEDDDD